MAHQVPGVVVLPRFPDATSGTGQRSLALIDAAANLGPVHVILLDGSGPIADLEARQGVSSVDVLQSERITPSSKLARKLQGPMRLLAPTWSYRSDPKLAASIKGVCDQVDAQFIVFRYARLFCAAGIETSTTLRVFVDVDDRDDQKYSSKLKRLGNNVLPVDKFASRLATVLKRKLAKASLIWFAAKDDIWPIASSAHVRILPNVPHSAPDETTPLDPSSEVVLFVGTYPHEPNRTGVRWFLDNCWADISAACPQAEFRIVGLGNWAELQAHYTHLTGVSYVGAVEDIAGEYMNARLCLCPVREGGGSKIKVVEAASFARPVVATSHSLRGFDHGFSQAATEADSPQDIIDACITYLNDPQKSVLDGDALRQIQVAHYSRPAMLSSATEDMRGALGTGLSSMVGASSAQITQ